MTDMETIYQNLTSVDIEEQKRLWDERGKGYYGEYLLFTELYRNVPGQCKILMNLNIPTENGKATEIDLLLIHETGLYVFEVKYYKGTIYGDCADDVWTQYFRTTKNSHFPSPVKQNAYHVEALRRRFPDTPIYSLVVFTNEDTDVRVTGWQGTETVVCRLDELADYWEAVSERAVWGSAEKIDAAFSYLLPYSPLIQETVSPDGVPIPLTEYLNQVRSDYAASLEARQLAEKRSFRKKLGTAVLVCVIVCAVTVMGAALACSKAQSRAKTAVLQKAAAEKELVEFAKKFRRVEPMNGGKVELEEDFLETYDVELKASDDLKDTFLFDCKIKVNGKQYGIYLHNQSTVVVQFKDGSVAEYVLSQTDSRYISRTLATYSPHFVESCALPQIPIYTKSAKDIAYIKLTKVSIVSQDKPSGNLLPGVEFELYSAE